MDPMTSGYMDTCSHWDKLPIELKEMVLEYRLRVDNPLTWRTNPSHSTRALLPLLLTSKEMKDMATRIWAEKNTFRLLYLLVRREKCVEFEYDDITPNPNKPLPDSSHFQYPRLNTALMIRKVHLNLTIMKFEWDRNVFEKSEDKLGFMNAWCILIGHRESETNTGAVPRNRMVKQINDMGWQVTLPNLVDLRIEIVMRPDPYYEPNRTAGCRRGSFNIDRFFQDAYTKLRAKRVVVAVNGFECGDYETDKPTNGRTCPFTCAMKLGTRVEKLIELKQ